MSSDFMGSNYLRRLPIYLLMDCSGSMVGDPIIALNEGLGMIYRELIKDPEALETAYISVIRFAITVDQDDLVALDQFVPPRLTANEGTQRAMGSAFHTLVESIEKDLVLGTSTQRGDYRPLVFLLTDGRPTDDYHDELKRLMALRGSRKPTIIALGCGSQVDTAMLHEVTEHVFLMPTFTVEALKGFFKWISGSIVGESYSQPSLLMMSLISPSPIGSIRMLHSYAVGAPVPMLPQARLVSTAPPIPSVPSTPPPMSISTKISPLGIVSLIMAGLSIISLFIAWLINWPPWVVFGMAFLALAFGVVAMQKNAAVGRIKALTICGIAPSVLVALLELARLLLHF